MGRKPKKVAKPKKDYDIKEDIEKYIQRFFNESELEIPYSKK